MAIAQTRPDMSGASARSHVPPAASGPEADCLAELLHGCTADCAHTTQALASLVQLLQGCQPGHTLSAGGLLALLEPLAGSLDSLCDDLRTANAVALTNHPHH